MSRILSVFLGAASFGLLVVVDARAEEIRDKQLAALRLSIAEAVLATSAQVSDRVGSVEMDWSAMLNEQNWSLAMNGRSEKGPVEIRMRGFVWGAEAEDWVVTYTAGGMVGSEPVAIHGKVDWPFDPASSDRLAVTFRQTAKFGENSYWSWIVGAEVVIGGTAGGAAGLAITPVTGPMGIAVGLAGFIGGAAAAISVSEAIVKAVDADSPPSPPALPDPPKINKDEPLTPRDGLIVVALTKDGDVVGFGPNAKYVLNASTKENMMYGKVSPQ